MATIECLACNQEGQLCPLYMMDLFISKCGRFTIELLDGFVEVCTRKGAYLIERNKDNGDFDTIINGTHVDVTVQPESVFLTYL